MITDDYVNFEIAKLLKEKEFDGECRDYYHTDGHFYSEDFKSNWNDDREGIALTLFSAPTIQMATKWFLKKHNIFICVLFLEESNGFGYTIENIITKKYIATSKNSSYKEPEEACEAAIKHCLEKLL